MNIVTQNQLSEYNKCSRNVKYFIENYVKIDTISGRDQPFILNQEQSLLLLGLSTETDYTFVRELDRQKGTTSLNLAYILWKSIFTENCNSLVISRDKSSAEMCLGIFFGMYSTVPVWMKPSSSTWVTSSKIALINGSNIIFTAEVSDAIRDLYFNIVYNDGTLAKLSHKENLKNIVHEYLFELNDSKTRTSIANDVKNYIIKSLTVEDITPPFQTKVVLEINVLDNKFKLDLDLEF